MRRARGWRCKPPCLLRRDMTLICCLAGRMCRADGWRYDHAALVASHRDPKARALLGRLRDSQGYADFITQRLVLAAKGERASDAFESRVSCARIAREADTGRAPTVDLNATEARTTMPTLAV